MTATHSRLSRRAFLAGTAAGITAAGAAYAASAQDAARDRLVPVTTPGAIKIGGHIGEQMDADIDNRIMAQDIPTLIKPFADRTEVGDGDWRCEYWGKWFTSAALAARYQPTAEHRAVIDRAVKDLVAQQQPDGYIGTRQPANRLLGWDIWGRKYVLLGLLAYYDLTKDEAALTAARRHADSLMAEVGPGKTNIADTGYAGWQGLPSSSVLEPIVLLYRRTGEARYLDFARYIVGQWSKPSKLAPNGLRLVEHALAKTPVYKINAPKSYEMTSCYEGLCELYRVTGNPDYLQACRNIGDSIIENELFIVGSGSSREVWFNGRMHQTEPNPDPMETCVTATWMKYSYQLLRLTGESRYADQLETSLYNALLGAMKPDGSWWGYYIPTGGTKKPSHIQHADIGLSCCVASGPRGLMITPAWALMQRDGDPVINLYAPVEGRVTLPTGGRVTLTQETTYPESGMVKILVGVSKPAQFALHLRIPAWSERTRIAINGKPFAGVIQPGSYASIRRAWKQGDIVSLALDMRGRVETDPGGSGRVAVSRGPLVLAQDRRVPSGEPAAVTLAAANGRINVVPDRGPKPEGVWLAFTADGRTADGRRAPLRLCDYASAGDTWSADSRFRVWLPQPLDLLAGGFDGASWIWHAADPGDILKNAPVGKRYFRRVVTVPEGKLISASLLVTADDACRVYINGVSAVQGIRWQDPQSVDIAPRLHPGTNLIAVEVTNTEQGAGLLAALRVRVEGAPELAIHTDASWESSAVAEPDWEKAPRTGASWPAARIVGPYGCQPWGELAGV